MYTICTQIYEMSTYILQHRKINKNYLFRWLVLNYLFKLKLKIRKEGKSFFIKRNEFCRSGFTTINTTQHR